MPKSKAIFITGTDTGIGKTVAVLVLGTLLKSQGHNVGIMKPVQCAGTDAQFLRKRLGISDDLALINPYYAPEPLSPHLALQRAAVKLDKSRILKSLEQLQNRHDIVLIEGAGGLMVPLTPSYFTADLIADLKAPVIIAAHPGLGTINHSLLTIREAQRRHLRLLGLIFVHTKSTRSGIPERTNPSEIARLSGIPILGTIPFLKRLDQQTILSRCQRALELDDLV